MSTRNLFNRLSYLQYPFMVVALFFVFKPILNHLEGIWDAYNNALIFYGIAISFATLQDTTKTQNKLSLKIYQNKRYARLFLLSLAVFIFLIISLGMLGMFYSSKPYLHELAVGYTVMGIGLIGALKTASEMAEYQQKQLVRAKAKTAA